MAWTADQIRTAVAGLTPPDEHTSYAVDGSSVIGVWNFDAAWSGPVGGGAEDRQYRFIVELDESDATYRTHEEGASADVGAGAGPGGVGGDASKSVFKGHQISKSFEFNAAPSVEGQDGHTFGYQFDSNAVKQPLMALLDEAGWKGQHGLIRKIFGG